LLDRSCKKRTPGCERQNISKQRGLFQKLLMRPGLLFLQPLEKETGRIRIGEITEKEL
jgi:hypothetical protein